MDVCGEPLQSDLGQRWSTLLSSKEGDDGCRAMAGGGDSDEAVLVAWAKALARV